ncbi:MAG: teichuronic acid biosynthesis glycosyltransferase TuaC [Planctomycetota bacterium]
MTSSLRIGVLTSLYPTPERPFEGIFAQRRWSGMASRGHDVRVCQPTPKVPWPLGALFPRRFGDLMRRPSEEHEGGISITRPRYRHISKRPVGNAHRFAATGMENLLSSSWRPDIVVCDYAWPAGAAAPLGQSMGIPMVLSGRGSDVLEVGGEAGLGDALGAFLRTAGKWIAVSQDLVDAMDSLAGLKSGTLVPNGVDAELFQPRSSTQRADLRAKLGWNDGDKIVLLVGHLIKRKDPLLALEAFGQLKTACPQARLVVVGKGGLEQQFRDAVKEAGLSECVDMLGERQAGELSGLYAAADSLLLCSSREGRPNVVLEALSSGLPVVATAAGGTGELLEAGPFDVVPSRDAGRIAKVLQQTLDAPPSRQIVAESIAGLSWQASLDTLEAVLFQHIVASRQDPGQTRNAS